MNVVLPAELEQLIDEQVRSDRYASPAEVIREGLRLLQDREARLAALRRDIAEGIAQADRGELTPAEDVFARLRQRNADAGSRP